MKFFLHTPAMIRIINNTDEFLCSPEEFAGIEPTYPGLPENMIMRYWTPERQYVGDGVTVMPDTVDCLPFVNKCATYAGVLNVIWAHVTISKDTLCANHDPADAINFSAALRLTQNPSDPPLPVMQSWIIRLRHESGIVYDGFLTEFVNGVCSYTYTYKDALPLGVWYLDEQDFDTVLVNNVPYHVRLVNPVQFTIYRELS